MMIPKVGWSRAAVAVAVLMALVSPAQAERWLAIDTTGVTLVDDAAVAAPVSEPVLTVEGSSIAGLDVSVRLTGLSVRTVENKAGFFTELTWPLAPLSGEVGAPGLPVVRRLFVVPAGSKVTVAAALGPAVTVDAATLGHSVWLLPVQPPIEKVPGARENAVFQFNKAAYAEPSAPAGATVEPVGIVRGQEIWLLEVRPVEYDPARETVTVYPHLRAGVRFGGGRIDTGYAPLPGLHRVVLNPELLPATRGTGNYLICVASTFAGNIGTFAAAKQAQGYTVTTYVVPPGTTNTALKAYIQSLYGSPTTAPDYVLLVGDTNLIPHWVGGGNGSPDTDLTYVCMDGPTDWYPDIAIGRFPARTPAQLQAMLDKTLYYQGGVWADPNYVKRSMWMASCDNYTISEGTHNWCINNYMIPNDIAYVKLYCHTFAATTQQVRDNFNAGRFWAVYSGHGSEVSWADGPPFSQSDVNGLVNLGKYPVVWSFACVTGRYSIDECFMETWVRAANKGAVVAVGSSVNSYWTEDDILQKKLFDAIFDDTDAVTAEVGPILNETKMRYLAHFGVVTATRRYFEMYNIMGDPALSFPGNCSQTGQIQLDKPKYGCESAATVRVLDCGPNLNPNGIDTLQVHVSSNSDPAGRLLTLTETNPNSALFQGSVAVSASGAPGALPVVEGDMLTVIYQDADHGGGSPAQVIRTAAIDCTGPTISNVQVTDVQPRTARITFAASEPARGVIRYGTSCGTLTGTAAGSLGLTPVVDLSGLQTNTTYYFTVEAIDEAGNATLADNGGQCFTFTTPAVPNFFTELFTNNNDLDYLSLKFSPNGSADFYRGCVEPITELPTDPAGGTPLTFVSSSGGATTDDGYALVTLSAGRRVSLYGTSYASFYVGTNGYITFGTFDTAFTESLANHFSKPRVAALFDDLNITSPGTCTKKELADRVVITWLNVTEYGANNRNTFQIELFYNGDITISYLAIAATDGLAGLSRGTGVSPDFFPTDLSAMGSCGPRPPSVSGGAVQTAVNTPVNIVLPASDDGLPGGPLTYIITSLPTRGSLRDPNAGLITTVPYALAGYGNTVRYTPRAYYQGTDAFQYKANDGGTPPAGGDSAIGTITITIGGPQPVHVFNLDTNPGWAVQGQWAWGTPTGGGSYNRDPVSGYTGSRVYGYNLAGDYPNNMPAPLYLTTTALNCAQLTNAELRFWRWLGIEAAIYDRASIEVSSNGTTWTPIWTHTGPAIADTQWTLQTFNIATLADNRPTVYIRWSLGPTDSSITYPGWNIDDIEIWGIVPVTIRPGDLDCDGAVTFDDIDALVLALSGQAAYEAQYPNCNWLNGDCNGDGTVNFDDIDPFVGLIGS